MSQITFEQALFLRPDRDAPHLAARSADFNAAWIAEAEQIIFGFGDRPGIMPCPPTVFAQPVGKKHVAVVRVLDQSGALRFHFLIVERKHYEAWIRDPFLLAEKITPTWDAAEPLPRLTIATESFGARTLAQVQAVLKRIKAAALREGEDPEALDFERTMENSESPALLGGAQILVDGGRLVFERPEGDLRMVSGLWLLLPESTRSRLWPTSFAFSQDLDFDVLVLPRLDEAVLESYTTEEQAADYPQGTYEFALQKAVETGTQADLEGVFNRRDSYHTIRLGIGILIVLSIIVIFVRYLDFAPPPTPALSIPQRQAAAASGIVGVGDPWTSTVMIAYWKSLTEKAKDGK